MAHCIVKIGECEVWIWPAYLETRFPDGLMVPAAGNDDAESLALAADLGYSSTWSMSRDHELLHTMIALQQGHSYSRVLRGVAVRSAGGDKEQVISRQGSDHEEALIMEAQRYVRRGIISPLLAAAALDLDRLREDLRKIVDNGAERCEHA